MKRQRHLRTLPFMYKCAYLKDYQRRTYADCAELLECSEHTVKSCVLYFRKHYQDMRGRKPSELIDINHQLTA